jgi:putative N-acetylmannosamine-6-phosphate epimerase
MTTFSSVIEKLRGGLVVSCQARPGNPMRSARMMASFAEAAELAGAVGVRVNGYADVRAIRKRVDLPIIGINKKRTRQFPVYITPTIEAARTIVGAGADIVAIDATHRSRAGGKSPEVLIDAIHNFLGRPVMADIDNLQEGIAAASAGADLIATTLSGYTESSPNLTGPDFKLVDDLVERIDVPVVCEGRIRNPDELAQAFELGAYAVVVGTAITNPMAITKTFILSIPKTKCKDEQNEPT